MSSNLFLFFVLFWSCEKNVVISQLEDKQWTMNKETLEFVTFCVGAIALKLNSSRQDVYRRLKISGIIDDYIVPGYDVLHTLGRSYIVDDITDFMKRKGVLA